MNVKHHLTLTLSDIRAGDLARVGGKGANLGELTHAGFPVPAGFCLTTHAFRRFLAACPSADRLYRLLESLNGADIAEIRSAGQQVRSTLQDVPVPDDVAGAVRRSLQQAGANHAYAVRSSATAEDLPEASFAGQQDTYLNIQGEDALLDSIRRCWISLYSDRALSYRAQHGFSHSDVGLAVVVQQMTLADASGVLFTADPVSGHRHTLTIDASFGLGEALVSGLVSPDAYSVDKRAGVILERRIADKEAGIFPQAKGGTRQVKLLEEQRRQAVLSDEQVLALSRVGMEIEALFGAPQDVEWAIAAGDIYVLQSRPITSLYPIDGLESPDDSLHVFFSMGHQQNMTGAMAPLSLSTFPTFFPPELRSSWMRDLLRFSCGRIFVDVTPALRHPLLKRLLPTLLSQFDALIPAMFRQATQRPEFKRPHGLHFSRGFRRAIFGILRRLFNGLWRKDLSGFADQINALIDDVVEETDRSLRSHPRGAAQIQASHDSFHTMPPIFLNWVPEAAAGIAASRLLPRLAGRWLTEGEAEALTLGLPGNVVTEMNLMLGDMAEHARSAPQLVALFEQLGDDADVWLEKVAGVEGGARFLQEWDAFLARYGARGPSEIDLARDCWHEDPLPLLRVIAGHIHKDGSSRQDYEAQIRAREAAFAALIEHAGRGLMGGLRKRLFQRLYHVAVEVGGMREHHKFMMIRLLWVVKRILKENVYECVAEGRLNALDEVWFLTWSELLAGWADRSVVWDDLILQRKADLARYQALTPPVVITSDGESPLVHYEVADAPPGALLGNPVSAGTVEGVVHVIHDPTADTLLPGEILVAAFTDPGWTPLFINAAGLVMEVGGALAHGSVVAREYGIPAVVGVRGATRALQTGQRVRVDGNRGIVVIL